MSVPRFPDTLSFPIPYPREGRIGALPLLLSESGSLLDPSVAEALSVAPSISWKDAVEVHLKRRKCYA